LYAGPPDSIHEPSRPVTVLAGTFRCAMQSTMTQLAMDRQANLSQD
jgi:hypothetical protein